MPAGRAAATSPIYLRISQLIWCLVMAGVVPAANGQSSPVQVSISSSAPGVLFRVDGQLYRESALFFWPVNSTHVLQFETSWDGYQYAAGGRIRYRFVGWKEASGKAVFGNQLTQVVVASPALSPIVLEVAVEYQVRLQLAGAPAQPASDTGCALPGLGAPATYRPGVVFLNGSCHDGDALVWLPAGEVTLMAYPYPGFAFTGWAIGGNQPVLVPQSFRLQSPLDIVAYFQPARRVRFLTDPLGLNVLIDRTETPTPKALPCDVTQQLPVPPPPGIEPLCVGEFDWPLGSQHTIGAPTPQYDAYGRLWVFQSFSNGMGNHSIYEVGALLPPETIVARFVRGAAISFLTQPTGLKLEINGRSNWPSYNFVAAPGERYRLSAPAEQTDAQGRKWVFSHWSNGGPREQEITVPEQAVDQGLYLIATYKLLSRAVIETLPPGIPVQVNGRDCETPCILDGEPGTRFEIEAPAEYQPSAWERLRFTAWSDGGPSSREITLTGEEPLRLVATYQRYFRLQVEVQPPGAGTIQVTPAAPDGFYPSGSAVVLTAEATAKYRFRRWVGDVEATYPSVTVELASPKSVVAYFESKPEAPLALVVNAASQEPDAPVAAGSVITIYGDSLAAWTAAASSWPLPQSLANATVTLGDHLLALLYASPAQINAVLPQELEPGEYELAVHRLGQVPVKGRVRVERNAPGLFFRLQDGQPWAVAVFADGRPVSVEDPAQPGQLIRLYATGLGPVNPRPPYGFPLPVEPEFQLADPLELLAGELAIQPVKVIAVPGLCGVQAIEFVVPEASVPGAKLELRARVQGRESNPVLLPLAATK